MAVAASTPQVPFDQSYSSATHPDRHPDRAGRPGRREVTAQWLPAIWTPTHQCGLPAAEMVVTVPLAHGPLSDRQTVRREPRHPAWTATQPSGNPTPTTAWRGLPQKFPPARDLIANATSTELLKALKNIYYGCSEARPRLVN